MSTRVRAVLFSVNDLCLKCKVTFDRIEPPSPSALREALVRLLENASFESAISKIPPAWKKRRLKSCPRSPAPSTSPVSKNGKLAPPRFGRAKSPPLNQPCRRPPSREQFPHPSFAVDRLQLVRIPHHCGGGRPYPPLRRDRHRRICPARPHPVYPYSPGAQKFSEAAAGESNARDLVGHCLSDTNTQHRNGTARQRRNSGQYGEPIARPFPSSLAVLRFGRSAKSMRSQVKQQMV